MHVVSDTSPLSCLASIQRLDLIQQQFGVVRVPTSVAKEVMRHPSSRAQASLQHAFDLGTIVENKKADLEPLSLLLRRTLDQGESDAISLAVKSRSDLMLIDEREGRQIARSLGLRLTGTLGILIRAKLEGSLTSLEEAIYELQENFAFSLSPLLVETALREVGER